MLVFINYVFLPNIYRFISFYIYHLKIIINTELGI